jgi:D-alanine--D-alanine ligase
LSGDAHACVDDDLLSAENVGDAGASLTEPVSGRTTVHIAVLMGGDSSEREISLVSGRAVATALAGAGHRVESVDLPNVRAALDLPVLREVDVAFPVLHGGDGEDGHLQAVLDLLDVPYALSGPLASALAMDKAACKRVMSGAGIPTPDWLLVSWDGGAGRPVAVEGQLPAARVRRIGKPTAHSPHRSLS